MLNILYLLSIDGNDITNTINENTDLDNGLDVNSSYNGIFSKSNVPPVEIYTQMYVNI